MPPRPAHASALAVLAAGLFAPSAVHAQYTFSSLAYPGAYFTVASGINADGQIVGYYYDATGSHGFVDNAGTFTTLDYPGALFTQASGINAAGQIVGYYYDSTGPDRGFVATPSVVATPEPGALALVAAGLGGLGLAARRRRRALA